MDLSTQIAKYLPQGPLGFLAQCAIVAIGLLGSGFFWRLGEQLADRLTQLATFRPEWNQRLARVVALSFSIAVLSIVIGLSVLVVINVFNRIPVQLNPNTVRSHSSNPSAEGTAFDWAAEEQVIDTSARGTVGGTTVDWQENQTPPTADTTR